MDLLRIALAAAFVAAVAAAPAGAQTLKATEQSLRAEILADGYPLTIRRVADEVRVPGRYIVLFKDGVGDAHAEAKRVVGGIGGTMHFSYEGAVNGFAATMDADAAEALRWDPRVALIEEDQVVHTAALPMPLSPEMPAHSWAMDRIDQRFLPLDDSFSFPANGGAGVHIYMLDSGIMGGFFGLQGAHVDMDGRIGSGADFIVPSTNGNDCLFHGTFAASLAAGTTMGVAKLATLHPVRVISCGDQGTASGVIAGVNWVTQDHLAHPGQKSVANVSLQLGGTDVAVDAAVQASINAGVVYTIAAGNFGPSFDFFGPDLADACNLSPQRVGAALTVGAMQNNALVGDQVANFSDFGGCVDLYAPGVFMTGAWITSPTTFSGLGFDGLNHFGTSWSAPVVAGVAALYLNAHPTASVGQVTSAIVSNATPGVLAPAGGSASLVVLPNRLLYMDFRTDIAAGVTASAGTPTAGAPFTYTFTVKNNGPYNSMDPVQFTAALPAAVGFTSATTTRGACAGGSSLGCNLGRLAVGDQATITVTVTAPPTAQSFTATGNAFLQPGQTDVALANNTASLTLTSRVSTEVEP